MVAENILKVKKLTCKDCGRSFPFTVEDQKKYGLKGYSDPIRCEVCRRQKKILKLAIEDKVPIHELVKFEERCYKCGRKFYTNFKGKLGENVYCDDCFKQIKYGKIDWALLEKGDK